MFLTVLDQCVAILVAIVLELSPFWSVIFLVFRCFCILPVWSVTVLVCNCFGLLPFWFVAVMVVAILIVTVLTCILQYV